MGRTGPDGMPRGHWIYNRIISSIRGEPDRRRARAAGGRPQRPV